KSHVESLPRDRMDHVRGVADQRDALGHKYARDRQAEGKRAARADRLDLAEAEAEAPLQFAMEAGVGERDDALGLARAFGPYDRGAVAHSRVAFQRQDRERAGRQKMLLGAAAVLALVRDGGDDARLRIAPAVARDAGALADVRARAIGRDQEARRNGRSVGESHSDIV